MIRPSLNEESFRQYGKCVRCYQKKYDERYACAICIGLKRKYNQIEPLDKIVAKINKVFGIEKDDEES